MSINISAIANKKNCIHLKIFQNMYLLLNVHNKNGIFVVSENTRGTPKINDAYFF